MEILHSTRSEHCLIGVRLELAVLLEVKETILKGVQSSCLRSKAGGAGWHEICARRPISTANGLLKLETRCQFGLPESTMIDNNFILATTGSSPFRKMLPMIHEVWESRQMNA